MASDAGLPANLIEYLSIILNDLSKYPYPFVANPPETPKRASVALILRINPAYAHWPPSRSSVSSQSESRTVQEQLDDLFSQEWVKHGDPEVLFIKRSSRTGDKWSGHIAFPGGKRDPEDEDDKAAAVRESWEEVGLDLGEENAITVGNLAQRVVTTSWGKTALMVLCPYVFILKSHTQAPLRLQPTEVASAHWVSLRALLSPAQRTVESIDVANRYAKDIRRWHNHFLLGQMLFAAVRLIPSESVYSTVQAGFVPSSLNSASTLARFRTWLHDQPASAPSLDRPLQLWGLTLGVVADFLDLFPAKEALRIWIYPTFTTYDLRFYLWALSYRFRERKAALLRHGIANLGSPVTLEHSAHARPLRNESFAQALPDAKEALDDDVGHEESEVGEGRWNGRALQQASGSRSEAIGTLLEGYYDYISISVKVTLVSRVAIVGAVAFYIWRHKRRL